MTLRLSNRPGGRDIHSAVLRGQPHVGSTDANDAADRGLVDAAGLEQLHVSVPVDRHAPVAPPDPQVVPDHRHRCGNHPRRHDADCAEAQFLKELLF